MASNDTHAEELTKLLGKRVSISGNRIYFAEENKDIARFNLTGLPSCCGAGTVYNLKFRGKSKDGEVERIVSEVIKNNGGASWSYLQVTTRNPAKIKMFKDGGWELKASFDSPKGMTYLFQTKVKRNRHQDNDW